MTFAPASVSHFLDIFADSQANIRAFPGCQHLELWRCKAPRQYILMTHSLWDNEAALEQYRQSELFKTTWAKVKPLFAERPEAWSLEMNT